MWGWSSSGDRLGLVLKPPQLVFGGQRGRPDHLERDRPVEADLAGLVDDPHAAAADLADQLVVAEVANVRTGCWLPIAVGIPAGRDRPCGRRVGPWMSCGRCRRLVPAPGRRRRRSPRRCPGTGGDTPRHRARRPPARAARARPAGALPASSGHRDSSTSARNCSIRGRVPFFHSCSKRIAAASIQVQSAVGISFMADSASQTRGPGQPTLQPE